MSSIKHRSRRTPPSPNYSHSRNDKKIKRHTAVALLSKNDSNSSTILRRCIFVAVVFLFLICVRNRWKGMDLDRDVDGYNNSLRPPGMTKVDHRKGEVTNENKVDDKHKEKEGGGRGPPDNTNTIKIEPSDADTVFATLYDMARMKPKDLRQLLEIDDYFQLAMLETKKCPWKDRKGNRAPTRKSPILELPWLPHRTPARPSDWFKSRTTSHLEPPPPNRQRPDDKLQQKNEPNAPADETSERTKRPVAIYYEHLSKAGGTSFCKLAMANMSPDEVPRYYCMPSRPQMVDGRVGSWKLDELVAYLKNEPHRIVSNEWEPFNHDFLNLQSKADGSGDDGDDDGPALLFVTTMRRPIDRLLSAYKFWGILNNPAAKEDGPPSLETFLQRRAVRAKGWKVGSVNQAANVARFNFATWKFGGGTLHVSDVELNAETMLAKEYLTKNGGNGEVFSTKEDMWYESFERAIRTLIRFDLVIPMELLSHHTEPMTNVLGWTNFERSHVVNMGKVVNNDAESELDVEEYDALWAANKLDMILYRWSCAIYLTRLYCGDVLMG